MKNKNEKEVKKMRFTYAELAESVDWEDVQDWIWESEKEEAKTWEKACTYWVH